MPLGNNQLKAHRVLIILIYVFRGFTLQCHQTEYQLNQEQCCPKCPTGSHVRNECTIDGGSTSCRLCMNRTYMNIPTGLKHCFPCTNCNAGSGLGIKRGCTTVSDAVCKPLDGFFCVDPVADGCLEARKHTECRPGQYISLKGPQRSSQQPPKNGCSPPKRAHKRPTGEGAKRGERKVAKVTMGIQLWNHSYLENLTIPSLQIYRTLDLSVEKY
ncbi:tumor necrosis factor receptor superfamily member 14-like isoform X5 [Phycodurus eques]|uniref:tumor necrosis factor receptor superfamily member 14-like isoform X5 n=1 Tax=Phycodurus eques TaxID=693459 RepID=UPI002ACE5B7C|nr:tumor necrosis factor receptor superfamily member 14-like isoform X5 [Phycodurus eques]